MLGVQFYRGLCHIDQVEGVIIFAADMERMWLWTRCDYGKNVVPIIRRGRPDDLSDWKPR